MAEESWDVSMCVKQGHLVYPQAARLMTLKYTKTLPEKGDPKCLAMRKIKRGNHEGNLPSPFFSLEIITAPPSGQREVLGGNSGLGVTEDRVQNVRNRGSWES